MAIVKLPDVGRLLDSLNKGIVSTVTKHPAATAGLIGTGIAASAIDKGAKNTESLIMREQMRAPGAKYAGTKTTAGDALRSKIAEFDFGETMSSGAAKGVGTAAASEGIGALKSLIRGLFLKAKDKTVQAPQRKQIMSDLVSKDPIVSSYERETPGGPQQAFSTMERWAPELSTDPNVVRSFLRQAAQTGGTIDYPALKALTDAEQSALRARNER